LLKHPFFDVLRDENTKLENGKNLPDLFNFTKEEIAIDEQFVKENLIPEWYKLKKGNNNNNNNNN
jgi:glycogen synthase kinase 3 beta